MWNGEFYPCKPDIFEKTYESMESIKEKTADELLNELGYVKDIDVGYGLIRYNKDDKCFIRFIMDTEEVETNKISSDGSVWILDINMDLLQAINKKCQELRLVRR